LLKKTFNVPPRCGVPAVCVGLLGLEPALFAAGLALPQPISAPVASAPAPIAAVRSTLRRLARARVTRDQ
jgi:hypothetical protein